MYFPPLPPSSPSLLRLRATKNTFRNTQNIPNYLRPNPRQGSHEPRHAPRRRKAAENLENGFRKTHAVVVRLKERHAALVMPEVPDVVPCAEHCGGVDDIQAQWPC